MSQIIYIMMFLSSYCFAAQPTNGQKVITDEQAKKIDQGQKASLNAIQKAVDKIQPGSIYSDYVKSETMSPNLESVKNRVYGNKIVKNKLVVFADFACGHCKTSSKDLKARVNENKSLVNLTYVFYPMDKACNTAVNGKLSDYSCYAAKLALCAEKEGKVWKAIDYLYEHQNTSKTISFDTKKFVVDMGKKLGTKGLSSCITSKWVDDKLVTEATVHNGLKIPGTPIVLLNNKRFGGTYKNKEIFANFIKFLNLKEHPQGK